MLPMRRFIPDPHQISAIDFLRGITRNDLIWKMEPNFRGFAKFLRCQINYQSLFQAYYFYHNDSHGAFRLFSLKISTKPCFDITSPVATREITPGRGIYNMSTSIIIAFFKRAFEEKNPTVRAFL